MLKRLFFIFALILCVPSLVRPAVIISNCCGKWSDPLIWNLLRVPQAGDSVLISTAVEFDADFSSSAPGLLWVLPPGSLCGDHTYSGRFIIEGPVKLKTLTGNYGASSASSNASFTVSTSMTFINQGTTFQNNGAPVCVGCTFTCIPCDKTGRSSIPCGPATGLNKAYRTISISRPGGTDRIMIEGISGFAGITMTDMTGRSVLKMSVSDGESVETGGLPDGIYLLRVMNEGAVFTRKLVLSGR
jgi:hypothetical protein